MKCKYCGEEFSPNTKGRKREYCSKEECLRKARNEANRKWYANRLNVLKGTKLKIVDRNSDEKKIVYCSTDRALNAVQNEDFTDVIELARELGAVRFKLIEAAKKCIPAQSAFDKEKEKFVHNIESLARKEEITQEEVVALVVEYLDKGQNRRIIKDKQAMLTHLLQGIVANPNEYVTQYIKNRDTRVYTPKIEGGNS